MRRRLDQHDLQRRLNTSLEQVPAPRRAVAFAEHHVHVQLRRAIGAERDVADQRNHFDLLVDPDALVVPALQIEEADDDAAEGADAGEPGRVQPLFGSQPRQARHGIVAGVQHHRIGSLRLRVQQLVLHRRLLSSLTACFGNRCARHHRVARTQAP